MRAIVLGLSVAMLAACGDNTALRSPKSGSEGPDEFAIVPTRALQMPPIWPSCPRRRRAGRT